MGVKGLWKLLHPSCSQVTLESLDGKVLAVDVSIWLNQFVRGMRDARGNIIPNAHLLGLFNRICKLLHYRVKPVFVFDGGVPALKSSVLASRRKKKTRAAEISAEKSRKVLDSLLRFHALQEVFHGHSDESSSNGVLKVVEQKSDDKSIANDMYQLPEMSYREKEGFSSDSEDEDIMILHQDYSSVDINSSDFRALPFENQHEILMEMKENRKNNKRSSMKLMPQDSDRFSSFQVDRLVKRSELGRRLNEIRTEMKMENVGSIALDLGGERTVEQITSIQSSKIASEDHAHYLLIKGKNISPLCAVTSRDVAKVEAEWNKLFGCEKEDCCSDSNSEKEQRVDTSKKATLNNVGICLENTVIKQETSVEPICGGSKDEIDASDRKPGSANILETSRSGFGEDSNINKGVAMAEVAQTSVDYCDSSWYSNFTSTQEDSAHHQDMFNSSTGLNPLLLLPKQYQSKNVELSEDDSDSVMEEENSGRKQECSKVAALSLQKHKDFLDTLSSGKEKAIHVGEAFSSGSDDDVLLEATVNAEKSSAGSQISVRPLTADIAEIVNSSSSDETSDFEEVCSVPQPEVDEALPTMLCQQSVTSDSPSIVEENEQSAEKHAAHAEEWNSSSLAEADSYVASSDDAGIEEIGSREAEGIPGKPTEEDAQRAKENNSWVESIGQNVARAQEYVLEEHKLLKKQIGQQDRLAASISEQMTIEAQELLQMFGMPFVIAPMEAEAQCAYMDLTNQTDGTITDDSDVWLFGATKVYKNIFNQTQSVEFYKLEQIKSDLLLCREEMINFALLCGSDYTEGVDQVGPVTAMELLSEFHGTGYQKLVQMRNWWDESQHAKVGTEVKVKTKLRCLHLTEGFPSRQVVDAYLSPAVDVSRGPLSWSRPDLDLLRGFAQAKLGWPQARVDEVLLPILSRMEDKQIQRAIPSYFEVDFSRISPIKQHGARIKNILRRKRTLLRREEITAKREKLPQNPKGKGNRRGKGVKKGCRQQITERVELSETDSE